MSQSIISVILSLVVACIMWHTCEGQISFHTDQHSNSFSVKAPGSQQTFTRYFGGQQGGPFQQQAAASQPQQQIAPAPQNYEYQPTQPAAYQQAYPGAYSQQQLQPEASQQQPQFISAQDYAAFLQQTQQQQAQPLQYNAGQQYEQQPQASSQNAAVSAAPQQQDPSLLGIAFSPSNQVSHVKFASAGLSYNF